MTDSDTSLHGNIEPPVENGLSYNEFIAFFQNVHACDPFPWQVRLTKHVLEQGWPKVIDLPTGSGKTAVLDTALFVMAAQPTTSPRRIVFVIDRRIVVDQVCARARLIKERVETAETPVLKRVKASLDGLSGSKREPFGVAALRGGIPIDDEWAQSPDLPWVVVSTVDQFGSRLLFRGYGITPRMHPIHAGLAGNDCLVFLDEVHLSAPFAETLNQITRLPSGPLPRRFVTVEMSATPTDSTVERFILNPSTDLDGCEELQRRVTAEKRAELEQVTKQENLPNAVLKIVKSFNRSNRSKEHPIRSIGVVVNRVSTARKSHEILNTNDFSTNLLTGRMRPLDRIDILDQIKPIVDPDGEKPNDRLSIVVATQAIEVGADFSFDAMITECAAIDSLRQRFGRLDRRGTQLERTGNPAKAWILGVKSAVSSKKPDPIYGESIKKTWEELELRYKDGPLDVGPMALDDFPDQAAAPRSYSPLLLNTHMDAWVQTNPEPIVQPSIDWFLHGIEQNRLPEVSILWRFDRSSEALRLVPPRQAEFVKIPIDAVRSWLASGQEVEVADVAQAYSPKDNSSIETKTTDWVRWMGIGDGAESDVAIDQIKPGDILVVDPKRGGLKAGTWDPTSTDEVADLGDASQIECLQKATLRLDPRMSYVNCPPTPESNFESDVAVSDHLKDWLETQNFESDQRPNWMSIAIEKLKKGFHFKVTNLTDEGVSDSYYILIERHERTKKPLINFTTMDGSDETGSFTGTETTLEHHLSRVGDRAGGIADSLGLPIETINDLRLAGKLHDLGKVDSRFQLQMVGGDPVELEMRSGKPLAKSLPGTRRVWKYPKGMRHEMASIAMIKSNQSILDSAHDKDLVLHLITTHHGFARPFPPITKDSDPQDLSYELNGHRMGASSDLSETSLALEMADRFWRLTEKYGYYGLAWLESILRLADHTQSAAESELL